MNRIMKYAIVSFVVLMVVIPLIPLVIWVFADKWIYPDLFPSLTMRYVDYFLAHDILTKPLMNSVILALLVTGISLALGFYPSKYLGTKDFRGKRILQVAIMLPALAPGIAVVFGMLPVFVRLGMYLSFEALVIGQITFTLPYMIMALTSAFKNYDTDYEDQSTMLGMGKVDTMLNVTMPMVKSSVAVGCMYTFLVSWSMYLFTSMYAPRGFGTMVTSLLPLAAYGTASMQEVAITAIMFFLPSLIFLIVTTLIIRSDNANERGGQI
jgi:ABC-type spermidine/putrescine transport system, permease component II